MRTLLRPCCAASWRRSRPSGRNPTITCTTAAATNPAASAPSDSNSMWSKRSMGSASTARSAATTRRSAPASLSSGLSRRVSALRSWFSGPAMSWKPSVRSVAGRASTWSHNERERATPAATTRPASSRRSICQYRPDSGCSRRGSLKGEATVGRPSGATLTAAVNWFMCSASSARNCSEMCWRNRLPSPHPASTMIAAIQASVPASMRQRSDPGARDAVMTDRRAGNPARARSRWCRPAAFCAGGR